MDKTRGDSGLFRQNILFSLLMTALGLLINILNALADRMALFLGWPSSDAGSLISLFALGSLTGIVLTSALADWAGKRRVILAGLAAMAAGLLMVFGAQAFLPLALGLFLFGLGFGPTEAQGSALLSDMNPLQASKWVNIANAGFSLGAILGPLLAVALYLLGGSHHPVFLYCGALVLALLLLVRAGAGRLPTVRHAHSRSPFSMFQLLRDRRFLVLTLMMFLYLGYEAVASAYIKPFFIQQGAPESLGAAMLSLYWGMIILGRLMGARLGGKELRYLPLFALLAALGMLILAFAPGLPLKGLAVALYGLGCGPAWPMIVVLATRRFPERSGAAMGMMMLGTMGGMTAFPFLIGTLPGKLTLTFALAAVLALLVVLLSRLAGDSPAKPAAGMDGQA